jgi:hypothetical protein
VVTRYPASARARRTGQRVASLAALLVGLLARAAGAGEAAPCAATASFDSDRVTLGQQVVYRVRILSRDGVSAVDWVEPPRFPGFRAEWLPGRLAGESILRDGARYRVREEAHALFPERAGDLRAEAARLRCRFAGDAGEQTFLADVPAVALRAAEAPATGRPPDFADLVGPVSVQTIVTPRRVSLGQSVRVAIMLRGNGNVWAAADPFGGVEGAEIFRRRPELTLETGARLTAKRHFAYDVVPLREGAVVIPAVRVAYFDPATGDFAAAGTEAVRVEVGPRAAAVAEEPSAGGGADAGRFAPPEGEVAATGDTRSPWRWWPAAAVVVAGAAGLFALRRRSRAIRTQAELDAVLGAAEDADGEAAALAHALRAALARRVRAVSSLTAEEIAALPSLPPPAAEAARLLVAVERARFDPNTALPSRDAVRRAVSRCS